MCFVFSCEVCKMFNKSFFYGTPPVTASALPVAASVFYLKSNQTAIPQFCYDVLVLFSSRHIVSCMKSRTRLFINLSPIVRFSK